MSIWSKEHVVVIMEFPDWVQVKMEILYKDSKAPTKAPTKAPVVYLDSIQHSVHGHVL